MSTDNLDSLVIPESPIKRDELMNLLKRYLRIVYSSDKFNFQRRYWGLSTDRKVLVVLLGEKARYLLGISEDDRLDPTRVSKLSEVKLGNAYPAIRKLEQRGLIENRGGEYRIPPERFNRVKKYVLSSN